MLHVLRDLMDCVEKADVDRAADMFENREQFRELFPQLAAYWQPTAEDEIEVMSLNSTSTGSGEKRESREHGGGYPEILCCLRGEREGHGVSAPAVSRRTD